MVTKISYAVFKYSDGDSKLISCWVIFCSQKALVYSCLAKLRDYNIAVLAYTKKQARVKYLVSDFQLVLHRFQLQHHLVSIELGRLHLLVLILELLDLLDQGLEQDDRLHQHRLVLRRRRLPHQLLKPQPGIAHFLVLPEKKFCKLIPKKSLDKQKC